MTIEEIILYNDGPMISSKLVKKLEVIENIPKNTASQRISRNLKISKIKGFYNSNQSFCFLKEHRCSPVFCDHLLESMFSYGKKYWYCLNAIKMNGGIISKKYLECYTNYPIQPLKSHQPFKIILQKFVSEGILVFNDEQYLLSPKISTSNINYIHSNTIEVIKDDILQNFHTLCRNTGLISYNTGSFFGEHGKYQWAFKGVSTISGLIQNGKPGFLLADILLGHPIYENDVRFFIEKLKTIQSFQKSSKIIPFVLVDDLDKKALTLLKKNGIIIGFLKELFGEKYSETLKELVELLNNVGASLKRHPDRYLDLINELRKYNEGLANNIKGTLFEFIVGHIHSTDSNSSVDIGLEIIENGSRHELDVLSIYSDKVVFSECKATNAKINKVEIEKWINKKIPAFRKWFQKQDNWKNKDIEFEYWSTSGFTEDAELKLKHLVRTSKKQKIRYYQSTEIKDEAKRMKNKKLKETIDNFFLRTSV